MAEFEEMRTHKKIFAVPEVGENSYDTSYDSSNLENSKSAEAISDDSNSFSVGSTSPMFTVVNIEETDIMSFAGEYTAIKDTVECVADVNMLLTYMVETERALGVTLSLEAYGVDPIVFNEAAQKVASDAPRVVSIMVPGKEKDEEYAGDLYELINVDGKLYLSCVSESLNRAYLHQVISAATEAVMTHGKYIYSLIGPRPLATVDGGDQKFINTLKLNSYELSVLLSYMSQLDGVVVTHGVYDGSAAISFERR